MILQTIQLILGIILLFTPGVLLSYVIFAKTDIIRRAVFSIVLAVSISTILGVSLFLLNIFTPISTILALIFLSLLFSLILRLKLKPGRYKTSFNKDLWYLIFFSLIGTAWRLWFLKSIKNFGDAYGYAFKFVGEKMPSLGFYTGMAADHSRYIGSKVINDMFKILAINNQTLNIFLITFIYLGFIYLIFSEFRNRKIAYLGIALMALGPIEIFHNSLSITSVAALSYLSIFVLLLLFKLEDNRIFWPALLLAIALTLSYYTASMVIILFSIGFIIALAIKDLFTPHRVYSGAGVIRQNIKKILVNKKIRAFLLIAVVAASFIYISSNITVYSFEKTPIYSNMTAYTLHRAQDFSGAKKSASTIAELFARTPTNYYKGPTFLRLSAIGWQEVFFLLCGLTFIFYIIRKKRFLGKNIDLLLCVIPILIVSYGFFHVNLPTRIFNYFAFFGLLVLRTPKKYSKIFLILAFIFMLITGFYVVKDRRIFFETFDKEIEAVLWVKNSLQGKMFSDQYFINYLVLNEYYNVTGAADDDPLVYNLFYQQNSSKFLKAINDLKSWLDVDYIALTKRMQEQYILMLDTPQKPLTNMELYETNLIKVYDNEDVRVYETKSLQY